MKRLFAVILFATILYAQDSLNTPDTLGVIDSLGVTDSISVEKQAKNHTGYPLLKKNLFRDDMKPVDPTMKGTNLQDDRAGWFYSPSFSATPHALIAIPWELENATYTFNGHPLNTLNLEAYCLPISNLKSAYHTYASPYGSVIDIRSSDYVSKQTQTNLQIYQGSHGQEGIALNLNLAYWQPLQINVSAGQHKTEKASYPDGLYASLDNQDFAIRASWNFNPNHAISFDAFDVKSEVAVASYHGTVDTSYIPGEDMYYADYSHSLYEFSYYGKLPDIIRYNLSLRTQELVLKYRWTEGEEYIVNGREDTKIHTIHTRLRPDFPILKKGSTTWHMPELQADYAILEGDIQDNRLSTALSMPIDIGRNNLTPSICYRSADSAYGGESMIYSLSASKKLVWNSEFFATFNGIRHFDEPTHSFYLTFGGQARLGKPFILRGERRVFRDPGGIKGQTDRLLFKYDDNPFIYSRIEAAIFFDILTKSESYLRPHKVWGLDFRYTTALIHGDLDIVIHSSLHHHSSPDRYLVDSENGALGLNADISAKYWGFRLYAEMTNLLDENISYLPNYPMPQLYRFGVDWNLID